MVEKFDCIVVGAGMAGNAAAYTLARKGLKVLQLERGEYSGSKNVQGAIMYADMLEKIIPDFRDDAPLERHLIEQRFWMMNEHSHTGMHYRSEAFNEDRPNRYTIIRSQFDKWFSRKVRQAGAVLLTETTALELIFDALRRLHRRSHRPRRRGRSCRRRRARRRRERTPWHPRGPEAAAKARDGRARRQGNAFPAAGNHRAAVQRQGRRGRRDRGGGDDFQWDDRHGLSSTPTRNACRSASGASSPTSLRPARRPMACSRNSRRIRP